MWRSEISEGPATQTCAPVSAMATVDSVAPFATCVTDTPTLGYLEKWVPAMATAPETSWVGTWVLERLVLLQHLLKWPCLWQPWQMAVLAGQEALLEAWEMPQFPQKRSVDCALPTVEVAMSGMYSSSSAVPAARAASLHNFPPSASWRTASKVQHITLRASTLSIVTSLVELPFQRPVTEAYHQLP
ncbi:hypothetical protein GWK47_027282 [Chionoecetes opilio]|uniref:Uncharacterized protein n=1 Tax=Chionoecetes opilio TaxID=41210 RepID=A0A8J8WDN9_CHIOP|nr:hypothetical protein GWK47_027282 [Chionoecetes opilio]